MPSLSWSGMYSTNSWGRAVTVDSEGLLFEYYIVPFSGAAVSLFDSFRV
jgi:hypothetical protein